MVQAINFPTPLYGVTGFQTLPTELRAIQANVVFGQTSRRCQGSGICRVDMIQAQYSFESTLSCCGRNPAKVERNEKGRFRFKFLAADLCKKMERQQFQEGTFRVDEDFQVPAWLGERLQCQQVYIRRGVYRVDRQGAYWVINF